jgi:hypothetical protein
MMKKIPLKLSPFIKWRQFLLLISLVMFLTACGSGGDQPDVSSPEENVEPEAMETAETVTDNPYAAAGVNDPDHFEDFFRRLQKMIAEDEREAVAAVVHYPMSVEIDGKLQMMRSEEDFLAHYDDIMSEDVKTAVAVQELEETFVNQRGIMIGQEVLWLGCYGGDEYFIVNIEP